MLDQLQKELKQAMKNGDKATMIGLRNIIGKINSAKIEKGGDLDNNECMKILKSAAKQLNESIFQYNKGGREDLASKELFELSIIKKYLPEQLSEDKITDIVKETVKSTGASSMQDMGKVMGVIMKQLEGTADGKIVQKIVMSELK